MELLMPTPATYFHSPTILLVHGAFADGSHWSAVIERLQARGLKVTAAAVPLRGLSLDSAYVAGVVERTPGPIVAVGHSYGGAVISNAATRTRSVVGLVFVAAFAPDEGERLGEVAATSEDAVLMRALLPVSYRANGGPSALEFELDRGMFHAAFAADLPASQAAVLAATQRPVAEGAFLDPAGEPAWKRLPSWAVVATADKAVGADVTRSMAKRAGAKITEVDASHVVMISQPEAVTAVILQAVAAVSATVGR